ncbi:MAG: hypothetical protein HQM01_01845 [Magnetococcales bacterium]|nr:hypothetical protein [Magnetococcales bacterium]
MITPAPLERLLTASAFAEAGEFETARDMSRAAREILLVVRGDEPQAELLVTTRAMMERLDAGVEILLARPATEQHADWDGFVREVMVSGRSARMVHRPGISWQTVLAHARAVSGIVCILVESLEKWGLPGNAERRRSPFWSRRLPCPLVVARPAVH